MGELVSLSLALRRRREVASPGHTGPRLTAERTAAHAWPQVNEPRGQAVPEGAGGRAGCGGAGAEPSNKGVRSAPVNHQDLCLHSGRRRVCGA